ncbi:GMP synthase (glutamine-hydrolysing) [Propionibacterium cyclohexanicum]|uniref:GMP synthase (Glutamine-hydrolysing) n=1 Tax=Propionibacterium cyclohexanicum TaxID=64702 RepID=A0A1H9RBH5_9ACTN|nr:type 1 glutamine amidotransferase [Propionibacterium cyclohexanicum]SER70040.1 GMP synthase (glutamine-hydrolysing) [Propionibacterium cyclohexanicum]
MTSEPRTARGASALGPRLRVGIVQLDPGVPSCRLDAWLDGAGASIRLARLDLGDPVPECEAMIVLGGRMNAYSENTWPAVAAGLRLLDDCLRVQRPVLAICLGHQLLARVGGGHVALGALDPPEGGAQLIDWAPAARSDPVLAGTLGVLDAAEEQPPAATSWVAQSHYDLVDELPAGSVPLASSARCAVQSFRIGPALGVQFHPEADPELIAHWARGHGPGARAKEESSVRVRDAQIAALGRSLLSSYVASCQALLDQR